MACCECVTFDVAVEMKTLLTEIQNSLAASDENIKKTVKQLQNLNEMVLKGLAEHEKMKREIVKDMLEIVKRRELNPGSHNKKLSTVSWQRNGT